MQPQPPMESIKPIQSQQLTQLEQPQLPYQQETQSRQPIHLQPIHHQSMQINQPPLKHPQMKSEWSTGLFSCTDNCCLCCFSCWCSPCQYGINVEAFNNQNCIAYSFLYYCAENFGVSSCLGGMSRMELRKRSGIDGNGLSDCCIHFFCVPCALTQEKLHIEQLNLLNSGTVQTQ